MDENEIEGNGRVTEENSRCECKMKILLSVVTRKMVVSASCSNSKDGGECVVRILNSWSLIRARKK